MDTEPRLLQPTRLLDFTHPAIDTLVERQGWRQLPAFERIGAVYDFVRNEIAFGYNASDELSASAVLADGVGQCNTKSALLMALMRAVGIRCRYHGFTIDKPLQKGAITGIAYALAPQRIIHSWVEVDFDGRWVNLEGFILDAPYLASLQRRFPDRRLIGMLRSPTVTQTVAETPTAPRKMHRVSAKTRRQSNFPLILAHSPYMSFVTGVTDTILWTY